MPSAAPKVAYVPVCVQSANFYTGGEDQEETLMQYYRLPWVSVRR